MSDWDNERRMSERAAELYQEHQQRIYRRTDRMFAVLMLLQWAAAIAGAWWLSPRTWAGETSHVHPHVWMAISLGGVLCSLPVALAWRLPGHRVTRYTIATAQVMFSSLLIHISGGRIETHFHVFGSLAFLAAYRDWRILIPPTLVVAVDHLLRGLFWPQTVFGITVASQWRWLEHAAWVLFEDVFLITTIRQSVREMWDTAWQTAEIERSHAQLAQTADELDRAFKKERAIVEGAHDAVIGMDMQGVVIDWNSRAEEIFGWTAAEAVGRPLDTLAIAEPYRDAHNGDLEAFHNSGTVGTLGQRIEIEAIRRDGSLLPVELMVTPIHGDGETTFCAFIRDITLRKETERELRKAKEDAEAANRAKSDFLANMSHEIRTPLSGILGFTEMLRRGVGTPEERDSDLAIIHSSGQHLLTLINDILDLSKVEAGRMEFEHVQSSPSEIIADVMSVLRVRAHEKNLRLECEWTSAMPETIRTDPARLRQLLMNLVSNAIKFTESGGVMVRAGLDSTGPEPQLLIEVEDTGIGIPESQFPRIFQPFDQGDNSITRRFGGTGLGLAISRHIAHGLGGEITFESEVGRGTTFRLHLRTGSLEGVAMLENTGSEVLSPRSKPKAQTGDNISLESLRVLLVEDGETNRKLITLILEKAGAEVTCGKNGLEGLELAQQQPFDLIIMDMQMPVMDGYTAAQQMRSTGCTLPIIALTAHAMRGDRDKCLAAGCTHYLAKPFEMDDILKMVRSVALSLAEDSSPDGEPLDTGESDAVDERIESTLVADHPEFLPIVEDFIATAGMKVEAMKAALEASDWDELAELAHAVKGSGGTAGFACLTEPAATLEHSARQCDRQRAAHTLGTLSSLVSRLAVPAPVATP